MKKLFPAEPNDSPGTKTAVPADPNESAGTQNSLVSVLSLYHIALVIFSVLGVFFHGYFFCFALFHVVVGNDILLRVIRAVTKNGVSLLWVRPSTADRMATQSTHGGLHVCDPCSWPC